MARRLLASLTLPLANCTRFARPQKFYDSGSMLSVGGVPCPRHRPGLKELPPCGREHDPVGRCAERLREFSSDRLESDK